MSELPISVQGEIFVDYLFKDFLYKYKAFFEPTKKKIGNKIRKIKEHKINSMKKESQKDLDMSYSVFSKSSNDEKNRSFLISFV